ncbi:MAG: hypothetical protein VB042_05405 [Victivallaceae bacterium]|nr:hypothetical protein [Victivallaceae bacterium]
MGKPKLPQKITGRVQSIAASTWNALIDCVDWAMRHPAADNRTTVVTTAGEIAVLNPRGAAAGSGGSGAYAGDFTLIITGFNTETGAPEAAVVDLERGRTTSYAGLVGVTGYSSVDVPRYDFTVTDGDTIVYMRTTLSNNIVTPEIMLTQSTIPYSTALYDVIEIGRVHYSVAGGVLSLEQSWRGGPRYIEYRWW